jgi:hypothetical protein
MTGIGYHTTGGCPSPARGPLQGFLCENYTFLRPPVAIGLSQGLTSSSPGPANVGDTLQLGFAATNYGPSASPPLALYIAGRPLAQQTEVQDAGGEIVATPILSGQSRSIFEPDQL